MTAFVICVGSSLLSKTEDVTEHLSVVNSGVAINAFQSSRNYSL